MKKNTNNVIGELRKIPGDWSQTGFSLVEMLIYLGLVTIFMVVVTNTFVTILEVQSESLGRSAVVENGQFVVARLGYDIARATNVTTPAAPGDQATTLVIITPSATVSYTLDGGVLRWSDGSQTLDLHGPELSVDAFEVTRLGEIGGTPTLRVVVTLTTLDTSASGNRTETFTTTFGLRSPG